MQLWSRSVKNSTFILSISPSTIEKIKQIENIYCYYECGYENVPNSIQKGALRVRPELNPFKEIIPFSLLKYKSQLSFYIDIELIGYTLTNDTNIIYNPYIRFPIYKSHIVYDWILENEELNNFKNTIKGQMVYSPNFMDDSIGIMCKPKGWTATVRPRICIWIKFYKLPYRVYKLSVQFKLNVNNWWDYSSTVEFGWHGKTGKLSTNYRIYPYHVPSTIFNNIKDKLIISITIDIKQVYIKDIDGNIVQINKTEWNKYNVI